MFTKLHDRRIRVGVVVGVGPMEFKLNGRAFDPKGRGFESRPVRFQLTALDKLLTRMCPLSPSSIIWYQHMGGDALRLVR